MHRHIGRKGHLEVNLSNLLLGKTQPTQVAQGSPDRFFLPSPRMEIFQTFSVINARLRHNEKKENKYLNVYSELPG